MSESSPFVTACVLVSPCVTAESMKLFHSWQDRATSICTLVIVVPMLIRGWWRAAACVSYSSILGKLALLCLLHRNHTNLRHLNKLHVFVCLFSDFPTVLSRYDRGRSWFKSSDTSQLEILHLSMVPTLLTMDSWRLRCQNWRLLQGDLRVW